MADFVTLIKKNKKDIIIPSLVLLVICIAIPLALALTNKLTVDRIAALEEKNSNETMAGLIEADSFETKQFKNNEGEFEYFVAFKGGETAGYIFKTSDKGYGGTVSVMTAVNNDGTVKSVAVLDVSNETPGLGQNAAKENFYSQYSGLSEIKEVKKNGADKEKSEINAVTGATVTSKAVTSAVNTALDNFKNVKPTTEGGGGQ